MSGVGPNSDRHAVSLAHNSGQAKPTRLGATEARNKPRLRVLHACNALESRQRESQRAHCHESHVEQLRKTLRGQQIASGNDPRGANRFLQKIALMNPRAWMSP